MASYHYDEDPNKGPIRHALRGLSIGTTVSRPYWRTMRNKIPGVGPEIGTVAGVGTGFGFWNAPSIARGFGNKIEQVDRVLDNVEDTSRSAAAALLAAESSTGNAGDFIGQLQDVTLPKIEGMMDEVKTALNQFTGGVELDDLALQAFKKKLPIIAGALAVTGVGAYAIHKYIGYRLAKAVEKVPKDEAAEAASTLARRLRGDEYGIEEEESKEEALV